MIYIIIPIYNGKEFINKCFDSLLRQTEKDFLAICVNDGSSDGSLDCINDYCKKDKRFILINKENGGLASARNAGINYICDFSRNDYICFLDVDDYFDDDYLEKLKKEFQNDTVDIVCSSTRIINGCNSHIDPHNHVDKNLTLPASKALETLYCKNYLSFYMCCRLYRANLFEKIRFIETTRIFEDIQTLYKVFHLAKNVKFLRYDGYNYVMNPNSLLHKKNSNSTILSLLNSYLEAYEYKFDNFSLREQKKIKRKIFKEFGRLYIMYMHSFDFLNIKPEEQYNLDDIKKRINVRKSTFCSNVFTAKEFFKKSVFLLLGEKKYSKL